MDSRFSGLHHIGSGRGTAAVENFSWVKRVTHVIDVLMTWTVVAALVILGVYASDREPPFRLVSSSIPFGKPGETIVFDAVVQRDISRRCAAHLSRSIFSEGIRLEDLRPRAFSAQEIARHERETPGKMRVSITIPENAKPGSESYLASMTRYECNQAHRWFKPIEVSNVYRFIVLAPD